MIGPIRSLCDGPLSNSNDGVSELRGDRITSLEEELAERADKFTSVVEKLENCLIKAGAIWGIPVTHA